MKKVLAMGHGCHVYSHFGCLQKMNRIEREDSS